MGSKRKRSNQDASTTDAPAKKLQKPNQKLTTKAAAVPLDTSPFLDQPDRKSAEFKREVEAYRLLADEDEIKRLNAASVVVLGLLGGDGVELSTLQRHFERRLFRGLASGAKAARLGFSIAITEILRELFGERNLAETKYKGMTFEKVVAILVEKTKPDGDLSGQEEKDHALGLLFGLQTFVKANILFSDEDRWFAILEKLFELSKRKPWLREECGAVIVKAIAQMNQSQAENTFEKLFESGLAMSPEGVGIWITAKTRFPNMKFSTKPWGPTGNPLDRLQSLAKALKESATNDQGPNNIQQAKQTGNWNPQLHFVWDIVLGQFSEALKQNKKSIKSSFENFWKVSVDENLFSTTASRERKFWGFLLFQRVLQDPASYAKLFPYIFSHNLVRCLINHSQDADRFLHRSAEKSLKVLTQTVEANPKTLVAILSRLISGHGAYNFDKMTKSRTLENILTSVNAKNAKEVVEILVNPVLIVEGSEIEKEAEMRRTVLGDYLLIIIRKAEIDDPINTPWIEEIVLLLAKLSYSTSLSCSPPLSEKSRSLFRNRLTSVYTRLVGDLTGYSYPCSVLFNDEFAPGAIEMDKDITKVKDDALSTLEKILKKAKKEKTKTSKADDKAPLQALALLYSLIIFQLYNSEIEAVSILDELKLCYDKLIRHKANDDEDSEVEASEVLVELLLSLVSKPSSLLRKVAQHVFQAFMNDITEGGLLLITDVLESGESLRGQQELFDQQPEDGEEISEIEEGSDDEDIEMDSDVEIIDTADPLNGHLINDSSSDESDDDDTEESDDEADFKNDTEVQKLNDALALALGTHAVNPEAEASDSDADMTDSEMMALDSKLVEIFSQRKKIPNKKQEQKDAKETMVNFKSRVLDLLEIYVKKQASNPLSLGLLIPMLKLIRTTNTKQLADKAHGIVTAFQKASKDANKEGMSNISLDAQLQLIEAIHLEAQNDQSQRFAKAASSAALLIVSNLWRADREYLESIAAVYSSMMVARAQGEIVIHAELQTGWSNWLINVAPVKK